MPKAPAKIRRRKHPRIDIHAHVEPPKLTDPNVRDLSAEVKARKMSTNVAQLFEISV